MRFYFLMYFVTAALCCSRQECVDSVCEVLRAGDPTCKGRRPLQEAARSQTLRLWYHPRHPHRRPTHQEVLPLPVRAGRPLHRLPAAHAGLETMATDPRDPCDQQQYSAAQPELCQLPQRVSSGSQLHPHRSGRPLAAERRQWTLHDLRPPDPTRVARSEVGVGTERRFVRVVARTQPKPEPVRDSAEEKSLVRGPDLQQLAADLSVAGSWQWRHQCHVGVAVPTQDPAVSVPAVRPPRPTVWEEAQTRVWPADTQLPQDDGGNGGTPFGFGGFPIFFNARLLAKESIFKMFLRCTGKLYGSLSLSFM